MYTFRWKPEETEEPEVDASGKVIKEADGSAKTKKVAPLFTGDVLLEIPKNSERLAYIKGLSLSIGSDGTLNKSEAIDRADSMMSFALKYIKEVNLVRLEDGFVFNKPDMLEYDSDGSQLLVQIASKLANGIKLGKN